MSSPAVLRGKLFCFLGAAVITGITVPAMGQFVVPKSKPVSGERLFGQQCGACHSAVPGEIRVGPSLANIAGRKAGSIQGYRYSSALKKNDLIWTRQNLDRWLADSVGTVRGTTMAYKQADAAKRQAIIAYLETLTEK